MYMEAWLRGVGCVPIHHLMEDAATAEISRSQLWQWARHSAKTNQGQVINKTFLSHLLDQEIQQLRQRLGDTNFQKTKFIQAKEYLQSTMMGEAYHDFLTVFFM